MERARYTTGSKTEAAFSYSRAVKIGDRILVSGTTGTVNGQVAGLGDARTQTKQTLENINAALAKFGSSLDDIVMYRVYVVDLSQAESIATELGETFSRTRPAGTLVGTSGLLLPELLVEIDVEAILGSSVNLIDVE